MVLVVVSLWCDVVQRWWCGGDVVGCCGDSGGVVVMQSKIVVTMSMKYLVTFLA